MTILFMIRLGGIKFSEELVQVTVNRAYHGDSAINELLKLISVKKINIPFLSHADPAGDAEAETIFCVARADFGLIQKLIEFSSFRNSEWSYLQSVGTLTIFPHKNSLQIFGKILSILGKCNFPIYSASSSISALAFNTEFKHLNDIASTLLEYFILPENHAPFHPEFQLKEISK